MNVIYNAHMFAISSIISTDAACIEINPFEDYATKYGLFVPFSPFTSGVFIDWINSDFKLDIVDNPQVDLNDAGFLHIDNAGRTYVMQVSSANNWISKIRCTGKRFHVGHMFDREFIFMDELIKDITKISEACSIVDERTIHRIIEPQIYFANDWAEYAKANKFSTDDIFIANRFKKL